jgi:hypothetical protein
MATNNDVLDELFEIARLCGRWTAHEGYCSAAVASDNPCTCGLATFKLKIHDALDKALRLRSLSLRCDWGTCGVTATHVANDHGEVRPLCGQHSKMGAERLGFVDAKLLATF